MSVRIARATQENQLEKPKQTNKYTNKGLDFATSKKNSNQKLLKCLLGAGKDSSSAQVFFTQHCSGSEKTALFTHNSVSGGAPYGEEAGRFLHTSLHSNKPTFPLGKKQECSRLLRSSGLRHPVLGSHQKLNEAVKANHTKN